MHVNIPKCSCPICVSHRHCYSFSCSISVAVSQHLSQEAGNSPQPSVCKSVWWVKWLMLKCSTSYKLTRHCWQRAVSDAGHTYFKQLSCNCRPKFKTFVSKGRHLHLHLNMASPNSIGKHCYYFIVSMESFKGISLRRENSIWCIDTSFYGRITNFIYSLGNTNAQLACVVVYDTCRMPFMGRKWDFTHTHWRYGGFYTSRPFSFPF